MIFDDYQVHSVVGLQGQKVRKKSEPELLGHPVKCNTETSSWHHFSWSAPPLLCTLMQNLHFCSKIKKKSKVAKIAKVAKTAKIAKAAKIAKIAKVA